ncbi:MAG: pilus assembly protein PilM [Bdellovibrionales bacterium]|nr:pilus assembly protein PilM [Bdellovibrionales bacterium]
MRVLGLDISKDAIACVELETHFGRFEIRETLESVLPSDDANPTDPVFAASNLLSSISGKPGRLITAAPIEIGTFRNIHLATKDKKAIRAALNFELEDDLPFESENLHYDFSILPSAESGSMIHVGAVKKDSFDQHLQNLLSNGINPDTITTDAWAYRCLFSRLQKPLQKGEESITSLLIGLEYHKTFFYVNSGNRPVLYREIPFGLITLERKLEEQMSASKEELRTWIRDIGVTGINEEVSDAITEVLELLIPEIKQIELAARSQIKAPIDEILVTGEGALLPGFLNWLQESIQKGCALFRPLSMLTGSQVSYSDPSEVRYAKALALAMTAVPADKLSALNLRKGPFSKNGGADNSPLELIKKPLPYLLITSLVFFATKTIEYNYYKVKRDDAKTSLERVVKTYFGGIGDGAVRNHIASPSKLKKEIQDDLLKEREMAKLFAPNPNSPLAFLRSLSEKVSRDVVVDMINFDSGSDNTDRFMENAPLKTSLSFIVTNAQTISRLSELLEKNFGLKRGNSEELTREGRKVFRVVYAGTIGAKK